MPEAELQSLLEAVNGEHNIPKIFPSTDFDAVASDTSPVRQTAPVQSVTPQAMALSSVPAENPSLETTEEKPSKERIIEEMLSEARQPPSADKMELIQQVIETVTQAHLDTCDYTLEKVAAGKANYEKSAKMEKVAAGKANYEKSAKIPKVSANYEKSAKNGAMAMAKNGAMAMAKNGAMAMPDMSKMSMQPGDMWDKLVENMMPAIKRVVKFCKRLPGFMELAQEDQIGLIQQGSFEVVVARYLALFEEGGMFVPSMEMKVPRQVVKKMPMGEVFEQQFDLAKTINALDMDNTEMAIFTGIMILNPERTGVTNHDAVHTLQGLFLQSLYVYLQRKRKDESDSMFQRIIATLPDLQAINENHSKIINSLQMKMPSLHDEVYRNAS